MPDNNVTIDAAAQHFVIIREALTNEADKIEELNTYLNDLSRQHFDASIVEGWSTSEAGKSFFQTRLANENKNGIFLVALDGLKYVGYMNAIERQSESYRVPVKCAVLENIMVLPEYQHKGVGKKMMEIFSSWCRDRGVQKVSTGTFIRNTNALGFFRHIGFIDYDVTLEICLVPKVTPQADQQL